MGKPSAYKSLIKVFSTDLYQEWEKDELLEAIYWIRQIIAISFGIGLGWAAFTGLNPFLGYMTVQLMVTLTWYQSQKSVDVEEFGGHMELGGEGIASSTALFLVCWIMTYTLVQW